MKVLLVTNHDDPHAQAQSEALSKLGATPLRFDPFDEAAGVSFALRDGRAGDAKLWNKSESIELSEVKSVLYRPKPVISEECGGVSADREMPFIRSEWRSVMSSLKAFAPNAKWINDPDAQKVINQKPAQLRMAVEAGLEIPQTVVTNQAEQVLDSLPGRICYKSLTPLFHDGRLLYTNEVTREFVNENSKQIAAAPGIWQEYVEKSHELRVTVIGDWIVPVRIDSQSDEGTRVDWRRQQRRAMYSLAELSSATTECLKKFHASAGLVFGAYDFIVTPDGREIFLEVNPAGQYLWLERELNLQISERLAVALTDGIPVD